jgi:Lysozyme like domain
MGLSAAQIMQYAAAAGFSGSDLQTAVAIALAESSGNPSAYNPETAAGTPDGEGSFGLWQIYLFAHPEFAGLNLYDPQTNANCAYQVYSESGGFSPWSTYNSGAYTAYLSAITPAPAPTSSAFSPSTGILSLPAAAAALPAADVTGIVLAMALGLGVLFAFMEG